MSSRRKFLIFVLPIILIFTLSFGIANPAQAVEFDDDGIVTADEVIDDDLFITGDNVKIDGTINGDLIAAHMVVKKIRSGDVIHGMTVRDFKRKNWTGLNRPIVNDALELLEEYNWIRIEDVQSENGGRKSQIIQLHPDLRVKSGG